LNLLVGAAVVGAAVAAGVALMLLVRRTARTEFFLTDTTRGSAIFGVVGTAFAVLLAFVVFVAFQSYNNARSGSESEAVAVIEQFRTSGFLPRTDRDKLQGELICYGRAVAHDEWPAMRDGERSELVDHWVLKLESDEKVQLRTPLERTAFAQLLAEQDHRVEGRRLRLSEAEPVVSTPVWLILGLGGAVSIGFVLLFADRREGFFVQGSLIAAVCAMVAASLLLVRFLDHPYEGQSGSVEPTEMERSIAIMEEERPGISPPCDRNGVSV
jgi:hypothetical protein